METLAELRAYAVLRGIELTDRKTRTIKAAAFKDGFILYDSTKFETEHALACAIAHEIGHIEANAFYKVDSPYATIANCERRADEWATEHFQDYIKPI